jgi:Response regulator containing CheY-like receiver domain and AraC-type DNA-binding domain
MHKAIIIEDEAHYVEALSRMLSDFFPEIEMIGTAPSVSEGKVLLDHLQPDIVFMDIELKDGNSFHLLRQLEKKNFQLIFTTAFNEYAIHAFKFSAIDYLLKPVNPFELKAAVERALERIGRKKTLTTILYSITLTVRRPIRKLYSAHSRRFTLLWLAILSAVRPITVIPPSS